MYAHAQDQSSRPTPASSSVLPNPQYEFGVQSEAGFIYNDSTVYPPLRSTSLPIPKTASSSLAAALDPAPERDFDNTSGPGFSSRPYGQFDETPFVSPVGPSNARDETSQISAQNRFSTSHGRLFVDPSGSFRGQHHMYHDEEAHRSTLNQSQSPRHTPYTRTSVPSAAISSTSYGFPHQPTVYLQSNGPRWTPDVQYSGYPSNLPHAPALVPPHYPVFQDYALPSAAVNEQVLDEYGTSEGINEWTYGHANASFQTSEEMYLNFNQANANSGQAWLGPSLDPQAQDQDRASTSYSDSSLLTSQPQYGVDSAYEVETNSVSDFGQSNAGSSADVVDGGYFGDRQESQQRWQQLGQNNIATVREQQPLAHFRERTPESRPSDVPHHPDHTQTHAVAYTETQPVDKEQEVRLRGHNVLMPPPPLPTRANTQHSEVGSRSSHAVLSRRHTLSVPPILSESSSAQSEVASPASSIATASARPTSSAPASSNSSLHDESSHDGLVTPRMATLQLNDAMWTQEQGRQRRTVKETFTVLHGSREPPEEMHIGKTSALERSRMSGNVLATLQENSAGEVEKGDVEDPSRQSDDVSRDRGTETIGGPNTSMENEEIGDDDFFNRPPGEDWVPARSGFDLEPEVASLGPHASASSLVSPISPTSVDEITTPGGPSAVQRKQLTYAYASPANPESIVTAPPSALCKVLSVIRHDAHLATHVSGLGGCTSQAYDGHSYLTDDSERDPVHLPPAPPGARSGGNPVLTPYLPHPLTKRGENWHEFLNPVSLPRVTKNCTPEQDETGDMSECDTIEQPIRADDDAVIKKLEKGAIKQEEEGEGWGFVEAGSHGPEFALPGADKALSNRKQTQRLKLSTEKKTSPKMACHFCRNRKIACGASKCGDPTMCNQCERRNIRCIFPTVSRRGMRARGPRSAHTVDGADEADKDSLEYDESPKTFEDQTACQDTTESRSGTGFQKKAEKVRRRSEKGSKAKQASQGKGKAKGKRKLALSAERQEDFPQELDDDVEMGGDTQEAVSNMQVDRAPGHADDPLASLAAEMHLPPRQDQFLSIPSSVQLDTTSSVPFSTLSPSSLSAAAYFPPSSFEVPFPPSDPGGVYALHVSPPSRPFTRSPLNRRN